eukprot:gene33588-39091_t
MAVRDSNTITQLETVSKTKVRGVLALLKHGEMLVTHGAEGEPVRLHLAPNINSFRDLPILKCELVWMFAEDVKAQRLDAMAKLMVKLQYFYSGFVASPIKSTMHPEYRNATQFIVEQLPPMVLPVLLPPSDTVAKRRISATAAKAAELCDLVLQQAMICIPALAMTTSIVARNRVPCPRCLEAVHVDTPNRVMPTALDPTALLLLNKHIVDCPLISLRTPTLQRTVRDVIDLVLVTAQSSTAPTISMQLRPLLAPQKRCRPMRRLSALN